jgi:O-antigen/teichoic acid export membrane protein
MQLSSIAKQSATYLVGDAARRVVAVIMLPLYTRYLSPSEYGIVELVDLFVMVATMTFGVLAISDSMIRLYHQYGGEEGSGAEVISTALWGCAILSGAVVMLAFPLGEPISNLLFHSTQYAYLLRLAFVAVFFGNLAELGFVYLRIRQWPGLFICLSLAQLLLNVGLNVWFIAFRGMGVWGFVLARLLSAGVAAIISVALTTRNVRWRFSWAKAVAMARFGAPLIVSSVSVFVIHFSDRFFLSKYGTLAQVGLYALAYKVGFLVTYAVGEPFGRVWGVTLYGYVSEPKWQGEFARVLRYLTFALFGMALALSVFSREGLSLLSAAAYGPAAALVAPIAFGYALREGGDFFRGVLFINRRTKLFGIITLGCALLNTALNFWWIPTWGPAGAAWATFVTWFAYMAVCWSAAVKEHRIPYTATSFARVFLLACVACMVGLQIPEGNLLLSLVWKSGLLLAFVGCLGLSGYFSASEMRRLRGYLLERYQALAAPAGRV